MQRYQQRNLRNHSKETSTQKTTILLNNKRQTNKIKNSSLELHKNQVKNVPKVKVKSKRNKFTAKEIKNLSNNTENKESKFTDSSEQNSICQTISDEVYKLEHQHYEQQIEEYLKRIEVQWMVGEGCLKNHKIMNLKFHSFLVRYMYKIYNRFHLKRTTLFLAVYYMDKYFEKNFQINDQIQYIQVSQASLLIAMKYEEIYPPDLKEWVDSKHVPQVLQWEAKILQALLFKLPFQTIIHCYQVLDCQQQKLFESNQYFSAISNKDLQKIRDRTNLLLDLTLFDPLMYQYKPTQLSFCIKSMAEGKNDFKIDEKMKLNVKWMVERNKNILSWLTDIIYHRLNQDFTF